MRQAAGRKRTPIIVLPETVQSDTGSGSTAELNIEVGEPSASVARVRAAPSAGTGTCRTPAWSRVPKQQ